MGFDFSSDILRKLIGGDGHLYSEEPPYAEMGVEGRRMPLYEAVCGLSLPSPEAYFFSEAQLRVIQDWIDQGAIVE